ncbi:hypothetical protein ES703_105842 [subsurface metagenome]
MKKKRNYDIKVKQTRILLSDYRLLKSLSQATGVSMAEALHRLIEHQAQLPMLDMVAKPIISAKTPVPVTSIRIPVSSPVAKAILGSTNVQLRATVAKGGSSNGAKQV